MKCSYQGKIPNWSENSSNTNFIKKVIICDWQVLRSGAPLFTYLYTCDCAKVMTSNTQMLSEVLVEETPTIYFSFLH